MPAIGVFERGDQLGRGGFSELGRFGLFETVWRDAIDATTVLAGVEVDQFFNGRRERPGMLDYFAAHVYEVKAAIRRVAELDGAEPEIVGGEELDLLFIWWALGDQLHAVRMNLFAMNKVA